MSRSKISGLFFWLIAILVAGLSFLMPLPQNNTWSFWQPQKYKIANVALLIASHGDQKEVDLKTIQQLSADGKIVFFGIQSAQPCLQRNKKSGKCKEFSDETIMTVLYASQMEQSGFTNTGAITTSWAVHESKVSEQRSLWDRLAFQSELQPSPKQFSLTRSYSSTSWTWWIAIAVLLLIGTACYFDEAVEANKKRREKEKSK